MYKTKMENIYVVPIY